MIQLFMCKMLNVVYVYNFCLKMYIVEVEKFYIVNLFKIIVILKIFQDVKGCFNNLCLGFGMGWDWK